MIDFEVVNNIIKVKYKFFLGLRLLFCFYRGFEFILEFMRCMGESLDDDRLLMIVVEIYKDIFVYYYLWFV